jgi:hypothetical protein
VLNVFHSIITVQKAMKINEVQMREGSYICVSVRLNVIPVERR